MPGGVEAVGAKCNQCMPVEAQSVEEDVGHRAEKEWVHKVGRKRCSFNNQRR